MNHRTVRGRRAALVLALGTAFIATPAIGATDITDIGTIDQQAIGAMPQFLAASKQMETYGQNLQKQYAARAAHVSQSDQQKLGAEFQAKIADKQRSLMGPLFQRAQVAIASVSSSHNLTIVLDKRMVVFGGQDITGPVKDLLSGVSDPVPPVSTPPPSSVGYVDASQLAQAPKMKSAQDEFTKFKTDQDKSAGARMKAAKSDADKEAVLKDYRKTIDDEQLKVLKPAVDSETAAISDVAKGKKISLVVDRSNVIFGGTDITKDVADKLK